MKRCADCRHVENIQDKDGDIVLRCACPVPFWVPLPVGDYGSWVKPEDGEKCNTFQPVN